MATPPIPGAPGRYPSSWGAEFRLGRVLTGEHAEGWRRGTLEWDFTIIPVVQYFVNGRSYYMGGIEAVAPRWNFTRVSSALFLLGSMAACSLGPTSSRRAIHRAVDTSLPALDLKTIFLPGIGSHSTPPYAYISRRRHRAVQSRRTAVDPAHAGVYVVLANQSAASPGAGRASSTGSSRCMRRSTSRPPQSRHTPSCAVAITANAESRYQILLHLVAGDARRREETAGGV